MCSNLKIMSEYKVGDFITVIYFPIKSHWLLGTNRKTFRLTFEPSGFHEDFGLMWNTDGGFFDSSDRNDYKGRGYGIKEEWFRLATQEEIDNAYVKEFIKGKLTRSEYEKDMNAHVEYLKLICPTPTPERKKIITILLDSINSYYGPKRH